MTNTSGAYIVSWDFSHGDDKAILLVGRQKSKGNVDIINAFQGQEAIDIYKKLSTVKKIKEEN